MRISQSKTAIFLGALLTIVGCGSSGGKGGASTGSLIPAEYSTKLNGLEITSDNKAQVKENQKNAIDVDANTTRGKALTYSIYGTDVDKFDINESTGLVTFKEAPDYENDANKTAYFFTVKVDDTNAELSQDINITVININDEKPIFTSSATEIVKENQTKAITLEATDKDNKKLTYSISGKDAASFSISPTGVVTFKKAPVYATKKEYSFIATANDGEHKTDQKVTIVIKDPKVNNKPPKITSANTAEVEENQKDAIDVVATDPDGHALTYSISGTDVDSFNIVATTGVVTFKEAPDFEGKKKYSFTAKVSDGYEEVEQEITITIKDVSDAAPKITSSNTAIVDEGQIVAMTVTAEDDDEGDVLIYSISGTDAGSLSIDATTGEVTFNTPPDYETKNLYKFTVKVSDTGGLSDTKDITITISNVNDGTPKITSPSTASVKENQTSAITVTATDPDGDTLTYDISDKNNFNISNTGVVTFKEAPDFESGKTSYTFNVTVTDGKHNASQTITITILDDESDNDTTAPVITLKGTNPMTINEGDTYADAGATATDDKDGDISAKIVSNASTAVNTATAGTYTVTYNVSDAAGNKAAQVTRTVIVKKKLIEDTEAPTITLLGSNEVNITEGSAYEDAGATATDNVDGNLTGKLRVNNTVDTTKSGTYTVTYDVNDTAGNNAQQVVRTVNVVSPADTVAPTITLLGNNEVNLTVGEVYEDAGATATDNVDGNLTGKLRVNNTVDTTKSGTYTVTYDVNDTAGNDAQQAIRKVNVTN
ncbi:MAG: DUF5011 domain-containing protein [Sulfurovum sp.]|nr:DUF5011 domain-containing protein [Sulfurovum sp.]